jgi:recombinational DNA repair ATPase RecF
MYLTKVIIENLFSFTKRQYLELRDYKLFLVGENGCGKTNILRTIRFVLENWNSDKSWEKDYSPWKKTVGTFLCLEFRMHQEDVKMLHQLVKFGVIPNSRSNPLTEEEVRARLKLAEDMVVGSRLFETIQIGLVGDAVDAQ